MSLQRSGLLVCKFNNSEDFNLTWPGGQTKQSLTKYVEGSIRVCGGFSKDDLLEIEVSYLEEGDRVCWKSTTIEELLDDNTINIVRIVRKGDPIKDTITESASKIRGLKESKRSSINQAKYLQLMSSQEVPVPEQPRLISREELKAHNSPTDCWISYRGKVYDITKYLEYHPGGKEILLQFAGQDISNACSHFHHWVNCERILQFTYMGNLAK
ncbi:flavohemoprotein b5+b5R cytochrome b-type NAD(P)H oxidoreductase-like protein [Cryptosporidium canis]|uniref:Flavohemoprotein b5+b5R cytochrome b-type NAD(P)H oxidoreductase-like protein n=1 Tax=Cryptosporidium canis TaxID=195482 RepID=A0A9D5DJV4_9CRYT|nr:flavohemoprotein b5+b5R cytochrome b-type NAD(P)H oxidoreductase-like protein [Cryptosporidium canis]